jgi:FKBP-type peptidyl-prolyl cis-trans isomerase 2
MSILFVSSNSPSMEIQKNTIVSLRYIMKNSRGEVLENIMDTASAAYLHGSGNILPALETSLEGLQPGQQKAIFISGENETGLDGVFYFDVVIDDVRTATDEELQKGKPAEQKVINNCGPGCCC